MERIILKDIEYPNHYRVYNASSKYETTICKFTNEDCCEGSGNYTCCLDSIHEEYRNDYIEGSHVYITVVDDEIIQRDDDESYFRFEEIQDLEKDYILYCLDQKPKFIEANYYDSYIEVQVLSWVDYNNFNRKAKINSIFENDIKED